MWLLFQLHMTHDLWISKIEARTVNHLMAHEAGNGMIYENMVILIYLHPLMYYFS